MQRLISVLVIVLALAGHAAADQASFTSGANTDDQHSYGTLFDLSYIWLRYTSAGSAGFIRFTNITIPAGSTITAAHLDWTSYHNESNAGAITKISAHDVDDAAVPADDAEFDTFRTQATTASTNYTIDAITSGTAYESADFTAVIQEVVDRVGWASGNDILLFFERNGGGNFGKYAHAYNVGDGRRPYLDITWTAPATGYSNDIGGTAASSISEIGDTAWGDVAEIGDTP